MMIEEFEQRTGFYPTLVQYEAIERAYVDFNGDKDAFCKAYKKNANGIAERIQREVNMAILKAQRDQAAELTRRDAEIERLKKKLDLELEWRPSEGTGMSQDRYESLLASCTNRSGDPHVMSEDEARLLVAEEFGFAPERIEIVTTVHTYEVNKHHQLRKAAAYVRQPLYDATDWNYVRFNVRGAGCTWMYEMVNGELETYSC